MTMIEWLNTILSFVISLAWPVTIVIVALILRDALMECLEERTDGDGDERE